MTERQDSPGETATGAVGDQARHAALFVSMVLQYSDLAMLALGRVAHPQTGQRTRDLEAARLFIDQLEMLEVKTRGNLSPEEASLLRQTLTNLRLAFVEETEKPETPPGSQPAAPVAKPQPEGSSSTGASGATASESGGSEERESKVKYFKKF